jgi:two-component system phosphate regulon sensor histidine kinase PhoR
MRVFGLAILLLLSLIGLMSIQLQLLYTGIQVEKAKFDRQIYDALLQAEQAINVAPILAGKILDSRNGQSTEGDSHDVVVQLVDSLLGSEELSLEYSLAITESYLGVPVIGDSDFNPLQIGSYRSYSHRMGGALRAQCDCDLFLHLQVHHFFPILIRRLYPLLVPSLAFLLMLILCLILLMRSVRQQKRLDRIKNDFINNLAHELKTPAFSSSLLIRLMKEASRNGQEEKSQHYLALMEQENAAIKEHIEKVLELASLEGGRYQMNLEKVSIEPVLNRIVNTFEHMIKDKEGTFEIQLLTAGVELMADEVHLQNAIQNLLDNAIKYGGQPLVVQLSAAVKKNKLQIQVQDNGPGLTETDKRRVFQKFYRVYNGAQAVAKGFGLGLNYTREVILAHRGRIWVDTADEGGSIFKIELPIKE